MPPRGQRGEHGLAPIFHCITHTHARPGSIAPEEFQQEQEEQPQNVGLVESRLELQAAPKLEKGWESTRRARCLI